MHGVRCGVALHVHYPGLNARLEHDAAIVRRLRQRLGSVVFRPRPQRSKHPRGGIQIAGAPVKRVGCKGDLGAPE